MFLFEMTYFVGKHGKQLIITVVFDERIKQSDFLVFAKAGKKGI